jgi:hypothetical protein
LQDPEKETTETKAFRGSIFDLPLPRVSRAKLRGLEATQKTGGVQRSPFGYSVKI